MICMTSLLTRLGYAYLSSTLQCSLFLQDKCVLGAAGIGGTTTLCTPGVVQESSSSLLAHHVVFVNEADFLSFVYDSVALEAMLKLVIGFLRLRNILCGKRKDLLFFPMVYKHLVQIAFLHLCFGVVLIVTTP